MSHHVPREGRQVLFSRWVRLRQGVLQKWQHWLRRHIVSDVPLEDACCEFGCPTQECRFEQWVNCKNRLAYLDAAAASDKKATMKFEAAAEPTNKT